MNVLLIKRQTHKSNQGVRDKSRLSLLLHTCESDRVLLHTIHTTLGKGAQWNEKTYLCVLTGHHFCISIAVIWHKQEKEVMKGPGCVGEPASNPP